MKQLCPWCCNPAPTGYRYHAACSRAYRRMLSDVQQRALGRFVADTLWDRLGKVRAAQATAPSPE